MQLSTLVLLLAIPSGLLTAQTNRGGITGTIFDPSGAVVPGATVTVKNLGTAQETKVQSSAAGAYSVISLDPVTYSVSVEAPGFKKTSFNQVKVDTGAVLTMDVKLETGEVSTQVVVQSEAALVTTDSGTTGTTVTERQIQDIPLVNRSVLDLALTQPGVSGDAGSEDPGLSANLTVPGFNLSVNGGRPGSTNLLADGVNNTGVSLARAMVSFSPETVQEFSVQTSAFSAEYGQTSGGVISATTKSGTNSLNGTALWYNRNPVLAAAPYTLSAQNRPKPTLKYNQFSLAAGGPVYIPKIYNGKNKTFWFAAVEPRYRRDFLPQDTLLPSDAMRQGDFSNMVATASGYLPADVAARFNIPVNGDATIYNQFGLVGNQFTKLPAPAAGATYLPFPGNIIPKSMQDASTLKVLPLIAHAGEYYINSNGGVSNLPNPRLLRQNETRYTVRIDHTISDKNRINARFTDTPIVKNQFTPASTTTDGADYSWAKQIMLADTHTISPNWLNDLRLNYTRGRFSTVPSVKYDPFSGANLNTELGLPNVTKGGVPLLPYIGTGGSSTQEDREERYNVTDIVYFSQSRMSWKFGVDLSHALQNEMPLFGATGGRYNFDARNLLTNQNGTTTAQGGNSFAQFLLGVPDSVDLRTTLVPYYYRWNSGAAFVQNDWKIKPNLTLNIGMRYSLNMPRTEKYDHQGVYRADLSKPYPLAAPIQLLNGKLVDSVAVVPFAFVGKGGRSRYMYPVDYRDFEPRFGFAWSPGFVGGRRMTVRGGYGLSHSPVSGSARQPRPDFSGSQNFNYSTGQRDPNYVMRLGENPPVIIPQTVEQAIGVPQEDGITYLGSLNYSGAGFAISQNVRTPYSQNWNFTLAFQAPHSLNIEVAYLGNKGTHLFLPGYNINPKDVSLLSALNDANINQTSTIPDPLGRVNTAGRVITVQQGTLGSPYLGFNAFNMLFDASANSIRHAAYIRADRRVARGLTFTSNYTFGKSIDDASSSGVDSFVLTTGQTGGNLVAGAPRKTDRSVSMFDIRHVINTTLIYDLPLGRGRALLAHAPGVIDAVAGGWTVSSVVRFNSGYPAWVTLVDGNQLTDTTHTMRPDMVAGVPVVNPLYDRSCPVGNGCQPYLNPSAFQRPVLGQLGNAPRTLDGARGPWQQNFDLSLQKNFKLGEGRRRLQLRADFLNAFNHPVFRVGPNNTFTDLMSQPNGGALTAGDFNTWATPNNQPLATTPEGTAMLTQINANLTAARVNNVLPTNFFTVPLPKNFYGTPSSAFDIRTIDGLKLFRLRQAYNTSFGDLFQSGQPRYIQLGLKLYF